MTSFSSTELSKLERTINIGCLPGFSIAEATTPIPSMLGMNKSNTTTSGFTSLIAFNTWMPSFWQK